MVSRRRAQMCCGEEMRDIYALLLSYGLQVFSSFVTDSLQKPMGSTPQKEQLQDLRKLHMESRVRRSQRTVDIYSSSLRSFHCSGRGWGPGRIPAMSGSSSPGFRLALAFRSLASSRLASLACRLSIRLISLIRFCGVGPDFLAMCHLSF